MLNQITTTDFNMSFGIKKKSLHWRSHQKHKSVINRSDFLNVKMLFNCSVVFNLFCKQELNQKSSK